MPMALLSMLRMCGKGSIKKSSGIWRCLSGNCHECDRKNSGDTALAALWFQRDGAWRSHLLCTAHDGMHMRENHCIIEIIDERETYFLMVNGENW